MWGVKRFHQTHQLEGLVFKGGGVMKKVVIILGLFLVPFFSTYGNVEKGASYLSLENFDHTKVLPKERFQLVRMALNRPHEERNRSLQKMPWAVSLMEEIAFDQQVQITERWRSLVSLGRLEPQSKALEKAVQHKDWFMRNAGLLALSYGPRKRALRWSRKLLDDPALVVRSAAVKVIRDLKAKEMESVLWSKLRSKENFKSGEGLWIRKNIVETLGDFSYPGQEVKFIQLLHDKDARVHGAAISALEKITKTPSKGGSLAQQRKAWLSWWKKK